MSYVKHNFVDGQVLTAGQLNEMDSAIYNNDSNISFMSGSITALGTQVSTNYNTLNNGKVDKDLAAQPGNLAEFDGNGNTVGTTIPASPAVTSPDGIYQLEVTKNDGEENFNWAAKTIYIDENNDGNITIS